MKKIIYLDNAATTKVAPEVVEAMLPYFTEYYGNPSSVYELAGISKKAVTEGREKVASVIGANPNDIYFTAGGSESDNWALKATYEAYKSKGNHIITTKIEHHAILHTCEWLEKQGAKITYIDVDENGVVDLDQLQKAITPETILISVMAANNEIGTLQPIKEIGAIAKEHGILFHTDAVQAFGQIPINVDECHIDMLSSSGHKINGPKGMSVYPQRTETAFLRSWWCSGEKKKSRNRKCTGYRRIRCGSRTCTSYHGRTYRKRNRSKRLHDQKDPGRDPVLQTERTSNTASAEQCKLQLPVYRGRISADHAGYGRYLCIQWFRLYFRISGSFSCTAGHWAASRDRTRISASDAE